MRSASHKVTLEKRMKGPQILVKWLAYIAALNFPCSKYDTIKHVINNNFSSFK